ncbi:MAG: hypothetical protein ABIG61_10235 [Planctomycetota bacterium]
MAMLIGIVVGLVLAWLGGKKGFYMMWSVLIDLVFAVYLAIMLTPIAVQMVLGSQAGPYAYAGFLAGITAVVFVVLFTITFTFFTGMFEVSLPKLFDNIGAALLGFMVGMTAWGLAAFILSIIPTPKYLEEINMGTEELNRVVKVSLYRACNIVNTLSKQTDPNAVEKAIKLYFHRDGKKNLTPQKQHDPNKPTGANSVAYNINPSLPPKAGNTASSRAKAQT